MTLEVRGILMGQLLKPQLDSKNKLFFYKPVRICLPAYFTLNMSFIGHEKVQKHFPAGCLNFNFPVFANQCKHRGAKQQLDSDTWDNQCVAVQAGALWRQVAGKNYQCGGHGDPEQALPELE